MTAAVADAVRVPVRRPVTGVRGVVALLLLCLTGMGVGLVSTGSAGVPAATGLGLADAGTLTRWVLPLSRAIFDLAAVATVGTLVAAGWLVVDRKAEDQRVRGRLLRASARWAALWAVATVAQLLATTSQVLGVPMPRLLTSPDLLRYGLTLPQGSALLILLVCSVGIVSWASTVRGPIGARVLAAVALGSMAPLLNTGHAATASHHLLSTEALLVHVLAVAVWAGGLLALTVHVRNRPAVLVSAVPRFSRLAGWAFAAVAVSGLVGAWTRIGLDPRSWLSGYGVLLLLKVGALVVLAGIGGWHRRRTLVALAAGRSGAFVRLAMAEVLLMSAVVGLAVVLARTAPPVSAAVRAAAPHASPYPTVDSQIPPVNAGWLLVRVSVDALVLAGAVAALVTLVAVLRSAARSGWLWTPRRAALFCSGTALTAWAVVGGLGSYSTALLSAQVGQLLVLGTLAPALLALGLPQPPVSAWSPRWLTPANGALLLVLTLTVTLETPLLDAALRSVTGHLLLALVPLAAGLVLFVPLLRPDLVGRPAESASGWLLLVAAVLGYAAWHLYDVGRTYAGGWFTELDWWWSDPVADQRLAGLVMAGFAVGLALAAWWLPDRSPRTRKS